jgi:thioredoxin 1
MIHLEKEEDFNKYIKEDKVLVDFYATWCGPCQLISPIVEEVVKGNENIKVIKIDVDKFPELSRKYGIMSIPTLMVFSKGKEVKKHIGYLEKEGIESLLK